MSTQPPLRAEQLIAWSLTKRDRAAVLGDLQEEFLNLHETHGEFVATRWYWRQALASVVPNLVRRARNEDRRRRLIGLGAFNLLVGGLQLTDATKVATWNDDDEEATSEDGREDFGGIDVTIPLAGLARGKYRLKLSAADERRVAERNEEIQIIDPAQGAR